MLEQKIRDGREVFEFHIAHCLEICGLSFRLEVGHKIRFVHHELVFCCGDYCSRVFSFTNIILRYFEQFLLLVWRYFRSNHHVTNVRQGHKRFLHGLISQYFNERPTCEYHNISLIHLFVGWSKFFFILVLVFTELLFRRLLSASFVSPMLAFHIFIASRILLVIVRLLTSLGHSLRNYF